MTAHQDPSIFRPDLGSTPEIGDLIDAAFGAESHGTYTAESAREHRVLRGHTLRSGPNSVEVGPAFLLDIAIAEPSEEPIGEKQKQLELFAMRETIMLVQAQIRKCIEIGSQSIGKKIADCLGFQTLMLEDPRFVERCEKLIDADALSAGAAFARACRENQSRLTAIGDDLIRRQSFKAATVWSSRGEDMLDLRNRLLLALAGKESPETRLLALDKPAIIVASDLSPSQSAILSRGNVKALIVERRLADGGHVTQVADALDVPLIVGVPGVTALARDGDIVMVNDNTETVEFCPPPESVLLQMERARAIGGNKEEVPLTATPAVTRDGVRIRLMGAIANKGEVERVTAAGVAGVGLFRSEFMFLDRGSLFVEEDDQKFIIQAIAASCTDISSEAEFIGRLIDFGADKITSLSQSSDTSHAEPNPALGVRGVRWALNHQHILRPHINAFLRGAYYGKGRAKILVPFIDGPSDMKKVREIVAEQVQELSARQQESGKVINFVTNIKIGAMIETVSAAWEISTVLKYADFISFGSTDLCQYYYSTDREGSMLSHKRRFEGPGFLRFLRATLQSVDAFNATLQDEHKRPVYLCGQMASKVDFLPIILGLGFTNLSISARRAARLNFVIHKLAVSECRDLVNELCTLEDADQSAERLYRFWGDIGMSREELKK